MRWPWGIESLSTQSREECDAILLAGGFAPGDRVRIAKLGDLAGIFGGGRFPLRSMAGNVLAIRGLPPRPQRPRRLPFLEFLFHGITQIRNCYRRC